MGITGTSSAVGVQGMGGIGKTVLAAAVAHDSEVRQAFSDGIYWLPVGQKPNLTSVAVTPDGRRAVSASMDKNLRVWDLQSCQALRTLEGHADWVMAVGVTADGRVVSASKDQTLRLWDPESGKMLRTPEGHTNAARAVAVTLDGFRAVSASADQTLRLWDLQSGEELATFTGEGEMGCCAFTSDGRRIVAGEDTGRVNFLEIVEADPTKPAIGETKIQLLQREELATES